MVAAMKCGRNSIGIEIDEKYCEMILSRLRDESTDLLTNIRIEFSQKPEHADTRVLCEKMTGYTSSRDSKQKKDKGNNKMRHWSMSSCNSEA